MYKIGVIFHLAFLLFLLPCRLCAQLETIPLIQNQKKGDSAKNTEPAPIVISGRGILISKSILVTWGPCSPILIGVTADVQICPGLDRKVIEKELRKIVNDQSITSSEKKSKFIEWIAKAAALHVDLTELASHNTLAIRAKNELRYGNFRETKRILKRILGQEELNVSEAAEVHYTNGEVAEVEFDSLGALNEYEPAYRYRPTVLQYCYAYGRLLAKRSITEQAEEVYRKCLQTALELKKKDQRAYGPWIASIQNGLAAIYSTTGRNEEALRLFEDSASVLRNATERLSVKGESSLPSTLVGLGRAREAVGRLRDAESAFKESLTAYGADSGQHDLQYERGIADAMASLASFYTDLGKLDDAKPLFDGAMQISERLAASGGWDELAGLAAVRNLAADFLERSNRQQMAESYYRQCLADFQRLAEIDPGRYEHNVAVALDNLSVFYVNRRDWSKAGEQLDDAIPIYRKLFGLAPTRYGDDFSGCLMRKILVLQETGTASTSRVCPLAKEADEAAQSLEAKIAVRIMACQEEGGKH